jgi:hypothetical protein
VIERIFLEQYHTVATATQKKSIGKNALAEFVGVGN